MGDTPRNWKCAKCKRERMLTAEDWYAKYGKPEPTGRVRNPSSWRPSVEYKCGECGHVGWSRHPHAVRQARDKGFCPEYGAKQ